KFVRVLCGYVRGRTSAFRHLGFGTSAAISRIDRGSGQSPLPIPLPSLARFSVLFCAQAQASGATQSYIERPQENAPPEFGQILCFLFVLGHIKASTL